MTAGPACSERARRPGPARPRTTRPDAHARARECRVPRGRHQPGDAHDGGDRERDGEVAVPRLRDQRAELRAHVGGHRDAEEHHAEVDAEVTRPEGVRRHRAHHAHEPPVAARDDRHADDQQPVAGAHGHRQQRDDRHDEQQEQHGRAPGAVGEPAPADLADHHAERHGGHGEPGRPRRRARHVLDDGRDLCDHQGAGRGPEQEESSEQVEQRRAQHVPPVPLRYVELVREMRRRRPAGRRVPVGRSRDEPRAGHDGHAEDHAHDPQG